MNNSGIEAFWNDFSLLSFDADYFVSARLLDGRPAVWQESDVSYVRWRHQIAKSLEVDPIGIQLVGSARLGYSLSPHKQFKEFHKNSDLDIAVVDAELFDKAWRELQSILKGSDALIGDKGYVRKLVFDECIGLDKVLPHLSFGAHWSKARDTIAASLSEPLQDRTINFRLYRTHRALREYQVRSVEKARNAAIEEGYDNV